MKRFARFGAVLAVLAIAGAALGAPFTSGNIVVSRIGDGSAALGGTATAVFLDEYTPTGTLVQSIPMPTAASGSSRAFTNSGSATSEGFLMLSPNGRYLSLAGYDAALGTTGVASSTAARVVGVVSYTGAVDTTTALTDIGGNNIRSAAFDGTSGIWTAGATGGVRYTTLGTSGASTQISSAVTNVRVLNIFNGQLYVSSSSGSTYKGVNAVGTGLPTTSGQTMANLVLGASSYDFYLANPNTLYVADDTSAAAGGILKYTYDGTSWVSDGAFRLTGANGMRGLTGVTDGNGITTLYAVTAVASGPSSLVSLTDTGAASTFNVLATAGTNTTFRGVDFAPTPEPATLALLAGAGIMFIRRRR